MSVTEYKPRGGRVHIISTRVNAEEQDLISRAAKEATQATTWPGAQHASRSHWARHVLVEAAKAVLGEK